MSETFCISGGTINMSSYEYIIHIHPSNTLIRDLMIIRQITHHIRIGHGSGRRDAGTGGARVGWCGAVGELEVGNSVLSPA